MTKLTVAQRPCGSCPYRKDVPSGLWAADEYDKLPAYDNEMWLQPQARFDCHQRDGHLCAGWLACHGSENLFSIRLATRVQHKDADPEVFDYTTDVPVFSSGQEACDHGKREIEDPGLKARMKIAGLKKIMAGR